MAFRTGKTRKYVAIQRPQLCSSSHDRALSAKKTAEAYDTDITARARFSSSYHRQEVVDANATKYHPPQRTYLRTISSHSPVSGTFTKSDHSGAGEFEVALRISLSVRWRGDSQSTVGMGVF